MIQDTMYGMRRTFSHVRHRVSLVNVPSNMRCMKVAPGDCVLEVDVLSVMTGGLEAVEEEFIERGTRMSIQQRDGEQGMVRRTVVTRSQALLLFFFDLLDYPV